ncbi:MAG: hypothetical protein ABI889_09130 [Gemmatimonadota bacterium]
MSECTSGAMRDLLPELVNGKLSTKVQSAVESHVTACTECAEELVLLRSLRPVLLSAPVVDTQRIASAVRAQTTGAASRVHARTAGTTWWRLAIAATALIAVSALGYLGLAHRPRGMREVAATHGLPHVAGNSSGDSSTGSEPAPPFTQAPTVSPRRSERVQTPPQQIAVTPPTRRPSSVSGAGALENLSDLSDDDVRLLTASLDKLSPVPDANPAPGIDPLGASLEDLSGGGS